MSIPRTLSLHESALSPSEYTVYIPLFDDLVDAEPNVAVANGKPFNAHASIPVPVREARSWLKGRFSGVESGLIDRILRIFHPDLRPSDMLSQSQFFAVLRLLVHAHASPTSRDTLDTVLVFVQPPESSSFAISSPSFSVGPNSTSTATTPGIGAHNSNNPFNARTTASTPGKKPPTPPNPGTTTTTGRPFSNSVSHSASALSSDEGSVPDFVNSGGYNQVHGRASSSPAPPAPNPFLNRANSIPQSSIGAGPIVPDNAPTPTNGTVVPPALPPRKPTLLPPPRHASQQGHGSVGSSSTVAPVAHAKEPPLKPPKPPMHAAPPIPPATPASTLQSPVVVPGHVSSPLIKQGLLAAKGAQRSAEQGLEKLRMWEVIKTSSNSGSRERERERAGSISSGGGSHRAISGERGPNGTIRIQSTTRHARGTSLVAGSYESPAELDGDEEGPFVTPTSTGVLASPSTPSQYRVTRSRSLHASSSPTTHTRDGGGVSDAGASTSVSPPIPPPRRKRPESAQIGWRQAEEPEAIGPFGDMSRTTNASGSTEHVNVSNPMASIQRQFHHLQAKTRPGLESARAKVEGKIIPGGYGKWGAESLTGGGNIGLRKKASLVGNQNAGRTAVGRGSEGSDEFEDADEVLSTDDDVRRNGWKPLKG
ncbi:hypothetical protein M408DRAFT_326504 [Serendipita vermifera MAFF 305830]|uniref:Uncharacterized protein n=1 Tax=Serendipita vermifera MAFF 305830 TaxID=933852 RepID=A0A0C3BMU6_SERVB|nr:hypothetical protein M408DRAFT_326504 [Serendipita vermifera MAFF 305830]